MAIALTTWKKYLRIHPNLRKKETVTPMRNFSTATAAGTAPAPCNTAKSISFLTISALFLLSNYASGQAVTSIITDYNGWYKTASASPSSTKPSNNHNLLAFTYNGVQYSTGADDYLLNSRGESFNAQDFWALPVEGFTGNVNSNTKVGLGQMADGVANGPSLQAPENDIALYLTDGTKGLNLGTCVANLPSGAMTFFVHNINPTSIGDGIPDILVTQIADPSGSTDVYEFINGNNARIGNAKNIVFTHITPVGTWTADFYEASVRPMVLNPGFTNTDRPMRLWAADLSEFGITAANYQDISKFKINLSGNSDVAFAAYNNNSIQISIPLPVRLTNFEGKLENETVHLKWYTQTETSNASFTIERSSDDQNFTAIGSIAGAGNSNIFRQYAFTDKNPQEGNNYYRLKMTSTDGEFTFSRVILIQNKKESVISVFPNPSSGEFFIRHAMATGIEQITLMNVSGNVMARTRPARSSQQTKVETRNLPAGIYYILYQDVSTVTSQPIFLK